MQYDCTKTRAFTSPELIADVLLRSGVTHVFVSPGSRNAPLIEAFASIDSFNVYFVVDERSAAFSALGFALVSGQTVALVCTSGSAMLNYGPALSEAFYRKIPMIAITADRPHEWIGQDDSQTIIQPGSLQNIVKKTLNVPVLKVARDVWYANRLVCEAIDCAEMSPMGPVHLNVEIDLPVESIEASTFYSKRTIRRTAIEPRLSVAESCNIFSTLQSPSKVMIAVGFMNPDSALGISLTKLSLLSNVVVVTETVSNLHSELFISSTDRTLGGINDADLDDYAPNVLITTGGALVSRRLKEFLRRTHPEHHWHVGLNAEVADCFGVLSRIVSMSPHVFFEHLSSVLVSDAAFGDYARKWSTLSEKMRSILQSKVAKAPWCELKAFATFIPMIPRNWNVQYSNGTPVRYAQLFGEHRYHRCDCNRGVSGIDGCTSTAVGASLAYDGVTLLVTGDMSAFYDISGLASPLLSPRLKTIVINNGGGGIFRFVKSTRNLKHRDEYLCGNLNVPLKGLAQAFGIAYFRVESEGELRSLWHDFSDISSHSALMEIVVPAELSAQILIDLLK